MADEKKSRRPMRPVTDETRAQVRQLHDEGHGRNEIARRLDRSPRTVSVLCEEMGLDFDRTATAVATEARKVDARARRMALVDRFYEQAHRQLDRLERDEHVVKETSFGKVLTFTIDEPTAQDVRSLMQAAASASTQAAKLEALDNDTGIESAQSMLGSLAAGLTAAYEAMNEGDGDAP